LIAGAIGIKLKVKRSVYDITIMGVNEHIDIILRRSNDNKLIMLYEESLEKYDVTHPTHIIDSSLDDFLLRPRDYFEKDKNPDVEFEEHNKNAKSKLKDILNVGFDEIFLLVLFKDFISVSYKGQTYNALDHKFVINNIYGNHNIKEIVLNRENNVLDTEKLIQTLKEHEYIKCLFPSIGTVIGEYETADTTQYESDFLRIYFVDAMLVNSNINENIQTMVNIVFEKRGKKETLLDLFNIPYEKEYEKKHDAVYNTVEASISVCCLKKSLVPYSGGYYDMYYNNKKSYNNLPLTII